MFTKIDEGDNQFAPIPSGLDHVNIKECTSELDDICKSFNIEDILQYCDPPIGIHLFDLFFLKYYLEKYSPKKVVEIGCGTSTRFMKNLGYNIEAFAISDVYGDNSTMYTHANLETKMGMDLMLEKTKDMDFIFIDGHHSYRFAQTILGYVDGYKNRPPIIVHDFLSLNSAGIYGEQYYILDVFLREYDRFKYSLKTYTALLDNRFDGECDKYSSALRCMALIINE